MLQEDASVDLNAMATQECRSKGESRSARSGPEAGSPEGSQGQAHGHGEDDGLADRNYEATKMQIRLHRINE